MFSLLKKPVSRRRFVAFIPFIGIGLVSACSPKTEVSPTPPPPMTPATPQSDSAPVTQPSTVLPMLNEKDPQALALGYVEDSKKADKSKFPASVATSQCSNCALYTGKPSETSGPCAIFPGKNVMAAGWCNSWAKKA
jgi:hypothetical protein